MVGSDKRTSLNQCCINYHCKKFYSARPASFISGKTWEEQIMGEERKILRSKGWKFWPQNSRKKWNYGESEEHREGLERFGKETEEFGRKQKVLLGPNSFKWITCSICLEIWIQIIHSWVWKSYPVGYLSSLLLKLRSSNWVHKTWILCHIEALWNKLDPVTEFIKLGSSIILKHFETNWIQ